MGTPGQGCVRGGCGLLCWRWAASALGGPPRPETRWVRGPPPAASVWLLLSPCPGCTLVILLCPPAAPRLLHCPLLSLF